MRRSAILLVASTACSFSAAPDVPGGDPDAPVVPADAPDPIHDGDGDGVVDAADNCPTMGNPTQANEDGDDAGNPCDPCPQVADPGHPDGDADGVGDACDPHPAATGDELLLFEPFDGVELDPAWTVAAGGGGASWTVGGGDLIADGGEPAQIMIRPIGAPGDKLVLDTVVSVTAIGPAATRSVALLSDVTPTPLAFDFCAVSFDSEEIELYRFEDPTWTLVEAVPIATPLGAYHLRSRAASGAACEVDGRPLSTQTVPGVGTHLGLRVRSANARFAYLAVYRYP